MPNFQKINCSNSKLGMPFTMPVFFDDGKYIKKKKKRTIKKYHMNAINQWNLQYLLTAGEAMPDSDADMEKYFAGFAKANYDNPTDVEELEELTEDVEEI